MLEWSHIYVNTLYTNITEVILSVFVYRLFHEDFSALIRTSPQVFSFIEQTGFESLLGQKSEAVVMVDLTMFNL